MKLLAPNGKPSNLTPEQYRLVRTPEFKAWFGDWENDPENASKVVDENGEPLICFHGSDNEFTVFENSANYFSSRKNNAKGYGENLLTVFINLRKPYFFSKKNKAGSYKNDEGQSYYFIDDKMQIDFMTEEEYYRRKNEEYGKGIKGDIIDIYDAHYPEVIYDMKKRGFDGAISDVSFEEIVALYPEQIKLADGSNTTFDGSNPDIRYADGGLIETLTTQQVEQKLGRKLHWWNDDVVSINGVKYKKVYLRPEYKRVIE